MLISLVKPALAHLPSYEAALRRGWSPDNITAEPTRLRELAAIADDPAAFIAAQDDPEGNGPPVTLPDGTTRPRLPGFRRWLWDGEFCGSIGFRWQKGSSALPDHVLGHIGYSVPPWKQGRGAATRGLALLLEELRGLKGLDYVQITADPDNVPSQKVILSNGGRLVGRFPKMAAYGDDKELLRFRIPLLHLDGKK